MLERAELTLYEASAMVSEPHEAYRALGALHAALGRFDDATAEYKNCLFLLADAADRAGPDGARLFAADSVEALERLGALLVVAGSVNEGRHYLERALAERQKLGRELALHPALAAAPGDDAARRARARVAPQLYRWMVEFLLASVSLEPAAAAVFARDVRAVARLDEEGRRDGALVLGAHVALRL